MGKRKVLVAGDERSKHADAGDDVTDHGSAALAMSRGRGALARASARLGARQLTGPVRLWLAVFAVAVGGFLVRFLVPTPVAQADNRDGPRLLCGLGLTPVTHGYPRFFRYAYFEYLRSPACAGRAPYPSSQLVLLELARVLTPAVGLRGSLNMIALGVLTCALAAVGIASLEIGRASCRERVCLYV